MQWLLIDRGYQLLALLNLCLLLTQSETLKKFLGLTATEMLIMGVPLSLSLVWLLGYALTRPFVQHAEDRAFSEVVQQRRDIDEILKILRSMKNENATRL